MNKGFWSAGHRPTLFAAFLYFDLAFMVWVLLGPLAPMIATDLGLNDAQKGLMVAIPTLAGAVLRLVNYYRVRGHQAARLDPLNISPQVIVPDLDPAFHGLGADDMDTVFNTAAPTTPQRWNSSPMCSREPAPPRTVSGTFSADRMRWASSRS